MGYLKNKYTKGYFLKEDENGEPGIIGVEGAELFKINSQSLRQIDEHILGKADFSNKTVIEFGYGRGETLRYISSKGARKIYGVDFSEDAFQIAKEYLDRNQVEVELFCMDAVAFLDNISNYVANTSIKFDIVVMFDFIEHVPRNELTIMFSRLMPYLTDKSLILINTPVFLVDNDVIEEGLKAEAIDSSDEFEETFGMHCNRYTLESLKKYMKDVGFSSITGHYFIKNGTLITDIGQPCLENIKEDEDIYEHSMRFRDNEVYMPKWHIIEGGVLKERPIYLDTRDGFWQSEYVKGNHDQFMFDYLASKMDLNAKVVLDIGAHIGYHSLTFASLVGKKGKVFSFEPNPNNIERMNIIFDKNTDLASIINVYNIAIAQEIGSSQFKFSSCIDNGYSSGGFVAGSDTPYSSNHYNTLGFSTINVETITLDSLAKRISWQGSFDIVKIDTEGAESLIIDGARQFIEKYRPIFLIELHSLANALHVFRVLWELNYSIKFLTFESEIRLFIAATPKEGTNCESDCDANELLKLYESCVKVKNCTIQNHLTQIAELISLKNTLEQEKTTLEQERTALVQEKVILEQENAILYDRYIYIEKFRGTALGKTLRAVRRKLCGE